MENRWIRIVIKCIVLAAMFSVIELITNTVDPIIKNILAVEQMQINSHISTGIGLYQKVINYIPPFMWIITLIIFSEDIIYVIQKIINKLKGEKENEEN